MYSPQTPRQTGLSSSAMLRAFCLKFLLNEPHNVALMQRLADSPKLRELCGFTGSVPSKSSFSRFFKHLTDRVDLLEKTIASIVDHLHNHLPDMETSPP